MNNVAYRSLAPIGGLHRNLSRIFDDRFFPVSEATSYDATDWVPRVDIREEEGGFIVVADVPGVEAKDIDITLDKNVLTIRGSRNVESTLEDEGFKRKERFSGNFVRQFSLPETADGDNITARTTNGVLTVSIPKTAASQPRSIQVISDA